MSVKIRPYRRGGWEVDITVRLPNGSRRRERSKAPVSSKSAAVRWGEVAQHDSQRGRAATETPAAEKGPEDGQQHPDGAERDAEEGGGVGRHREDAVLHQIASSVEMVDSIL